MWRVVSFAAVFRNVTQRSPERGALRDIPKDGCEDYVEGGRCAVFRKTFIEGEKMEKQVTKMRAISDEKYKLHLNATYEFLKGVSQIFRGTKQINGQKIIA